MLKKIDAEKAARDRQRQLEQTRIAKNLRQALDGIAPAQVAEACGVTEQAVSNWIRTGKITKENMTIVARLSGRTMGQLLGAEDTGAPAPNGDAGVVEQRLRALPPKVKARVEAALLALFDALGERQRPRKRADIEGQEVFNNLKPSPRRAPTAAPPSGRRKHTV
jgi:transcriptional regulator with XRE-family HTH domain